MKKRLLAALAIVALTTSVAVADTLIDGHRSVDPATFDIKNIKLGMSSDQVASIYLGLSDDQTNINKPDLTKDHCTNEKIAALRANEFPNTRERNCVTFMGLGGDNYSLSVSFVEDWPAHPGVTRATNITYFPYGLKTQADVKAFRDAVLSKYGAPTYRDGGTMLYCPITKTHPKCALNFTYKQVGTSVFRYLSFTDSQLSLHDSEVKQKFDERSERAMEKIPTKKIKI